MAVMSGDLMISVSGVRGIVGRGLTPTLLTEEALAFSTLTRGGAVVLARDTRPSGVMARHAVLSGLLAAGSPVVDIGMVPTPTAQLAVEHHRARGRHRDHRQPQPGRVERAQVHRPRRSLPDPPARARRSQELHRRRRWRLRAASALGAVTERSRRGASGISKRILALPVVAAAAVRRAALGGGAGLRARRGRRSCARAARAARLRASEVIDLEPDGRFRRGPSRCRRTSGTLGALVRRSGADVGFALDPDVDRLALVDADRRADRRGVHAGAGAARVLASARARW